MPRSPPSTRAKVKRTADKNSGRRSLSLSSPGVSAIPPTATMASSLSLTDIETTITSCLSNDSFVNKLVNLLVPRVKDVVVEALAESLREARKEIKDLRGQLSSLKDEMKKVETVAASRSDDLEQYTRRHNLRIFGVPEVDGEDTDTEVTKIFKDKLKLDIPLERLDRTHRVGRKPVPAADGSPRWRPIIVRFTSYRDRRSVFSAKKLLRGAGVVVREDLTAQRMEVLRAAISRYGVRNTWTSDGRVFWVSNGVRGAASGMSDFK